MKIEFPVPVQAVTKGPDQHFFGYYEKTPWNLSGTYMLGLETSFTTRMPTGDDQATIGLIELDEQCAFRALTDTRAWNMQQGCMLQWLPTDPERKIIYNDREDGKFISIVMDIHTGQKRALPYPVYAVSKSGRFALSLNFSRLHRFRPVTGYAGVDDAAAAKLCPPDDGIRWMDIETGENKLILSLAEIAAYGHMDSMDGVEHWVEHLVLNPTDTRFFFVHRWRPDEQKDYWLTRLMTANADGSELRCLTDHEKVSHMDWKNEQEVLVWARRYGIGDHFYLINDRTLEVNLYSPENLTKDGHCSYSPDGKFLLVDCKEDLYVRVLLVRLADDQRFDIGRFYSPPEWRGDIRCDLHPRWNRDGTQVCIDSTHEGHRQIYVLDVSRIVKPESANQGGR